METRDGKNLTPKQRQLLTRRAKAVEKMQKARAGYYLTRAQLARFEEELLQSGLSASTIYRVAVRFW